MKISGYVLEEILEKLGQDFEEGLAELNALLKKYPDDNEAKDIAHRMEKERERALEELKTLAHLRKLENSGSSGTLPFYQKKEGTSGTR